jgi:hypothetical protein
VSSSKTVGLQPFRKIVQLMFQSPLIQIPENANIKEAPEEKEFLYKFRKEKRFQVTF